MANVKPGPARPVPLELLDESPFSARTEWGDLETFGQVIARHGCQPLLARPGKSGRLELVYGHRRLRAAKLACLAELQVEVRRMPDEEARDVHSQENLQRLDLHPLEEARLLEEHVKAGRSVDAAADALGVPRRRAHRRLRLVQLDGQVQLALQQGEIPLGVAEQIAKAEERKQQREVLAWVLSGDRAMPSAEAVASHVHDRVLLRLAKAPWDLADAELVKAAGACTTCPKRSGNQSMLFDGSDPAELCTDRGCWHRKENAEWERRTKAAKAEGRKVLSAAEAKKAFGARGGRVYSSSGYADLDDSHCYDLGLYGDKTPREALGRKAVDDLGVILARDSEGGIHELVKLPEAKRALAARRKKASATGGGGKATEAKTAEDRAREKRDRERERERQELRAAVEIEVLNRAVAAAEAKHSGAWTVILRGLLDEVPWQRTTAALVRRGLLDKRATYEAGHRALKKFLGAASGPDLFGLAVELTFPPAGQAISHTGQSRKEAAELLGLDAKAIEREVKQRRAAAKKAMAASAKRSGTKVRRST